MDDLLQTFGDEVSAILRHPVVTLALQLVVAYLVILWLAAAYWTFRDLRARTRDPFLPYLAAGGVVVLTPIAFPLAVLAYRVVRPQETLAEGRTRDLEAYVLRAEVDQAACAMCGTAVLDDWMRCPACGNHLAVTCHACGGRIEPDWSVCAWCARDLEPFGEPAVDVPPPLPVPAAALVEPEPLPPEPRGAIPGWRADPVEATAEAAWDLDPVAATADDDETVVVRPVMASDPRRHGTGIPSLVGGGPERGVSRHR